MFIKRLFCKNHQWEKIDYKEWLDDTGHVVARTTYYKCKKCGKKYGYNHKMPSDYRL
jgi:hypothetical protein